jgi:hypothetical protein
LSSDTSITGESSESKQREPLNLCTILYHELALVEVPCRRIANSFQEDPIVLGFATSLAIAELHSLMLPIALVQGALLPFLI